MALAAQAQAQPSSPAWKVEVVTADLDYPWSLQRSGSTVIATEAGGNVVMVDGNQQLTAFPQRPEPAPARSK
jgi:glucose/arabinose dehydrogenase